MRTKTKKTQSSQKTVHELETVLVDLRSHYNEEQEKNQFLLYRLGKLRSELVQNDNVTSDLKDRLTKFIDNTFNDYSKNY